MTISQIAVLGAVAVLIGRLPKGRQLGMLAISALVVFWLQPVEPFKTLQFWLPLGTLGVAVLSWALTCTPEVRGLRQNWPAIVVLAVVILLADLNRYFGFAAIYRTAVPALRLTLLALVLISAIAFVIARWQVMKRFWQAAVLISIILLFISLKSPLLMQEAVVHLFAMRGAATPQEIPALSWLGFSYVAFRLIHTIRDRQNSRLPSVTLAEYVNYIIFFPSFTAGPIDRIERFINDLRRPLALENADWIEAGTRLFVGLFKKFVIADLLAVISINDVVVSQVKSAGWMWIFLYAYAFRIYLDFSGYTDVAIGMGRLMGIHLPENFSAPYLKPNLSQFWNSWHMSLTQWFRSYFFNPLTRAMRSAEHAFPVWLIIFMVQISTMLLIGLWHGITWGFAAWGLWHGVGLFIHNRWSELLRNRKPGWTDGPRVQSVMNALGVFLTFNYVALGWLFFNLSTPAIAWQAMLKLFRLA